MKRIFFTTLISFIFIGVFAQDNNFGIKWSGFVKNDFFFDSRQNVTAREGHFLLWPAAEVLDINGEDINAKPNFNFLSIQTRLKGSITGPDAFGAKTSGLIEGAFFGHSNGDVNGFRLRHAFVKMNWDNTELLFGQTWSPYFITGCFPGVVSFNTGVPFQPFSRNPQVRLTKSMGNMKVAVSAFSQRDFTSATGSVGLRNSSIPEMHVGLSYNKKNKEKSCEILAGIGGGYKTLVPRLLTDSNIVADESVGSFISQAFLKIKTKTVTLKFEGVYGQNTYDLLGISSFAVESVDPVTDERTYVPLQSMTFWTDIHTNGSTFQFGVFAGYTKNTGAGKEIEPIFFGTRSNIDHVYRVAPRVIFNSGKTRFAGEIEYTAAAFGNINEKGEVTDAVDVANIRFLIGVYYFF